MERTKIYTLLTLLPFLLLMGCDTEYNANACNVLSMKRYKGVPTSKKQFEENCKEFEIKYTAKVCQSALEHLIRTGSLIETKKEFGDPIEHCFSQSDLRRFAK
jgi:hypothetical protein